MYKITKYKQSHSIKYQILSGVSAHPINGGTPEVVENTYNNLSKAADNIIEGKGYKYYIKDRYMEPNYGIMGLNLRIYESKELLDKELNSRKLAKIKAEKEYQKYLVKKAKWDEEEKKVKEEDDKILNKLYKSKLFNTNKIKVTFPSYNAAGQYYSGDLVVEVSDKLVEKILEGKRVKYRKVNHAGYFGDSYYTKLIGEDFLDYKLVNKIINWVNKNTKWKFNKINKSYKPREPMAYCVLDESKYPYKGNARIPSCMDEEVLDKLNNYETIAFDIRERSNI